MTSSSNHRGAAKTTLPWTTAGEITLCTAWCNAMDTYVTRDIHSRKGFWEEVSANFEKDMRGTIRGYDVIVLKWKNSIRPKVVAVYRISNEVRLQERLVAKHVIHGVGYACGDDLYAHAHACGDDLCAHACGGDFCVHASVCVMRGLLE
ncbi:hypothetical protein Tco_0888875 [Tanacetum coccineum]